MKEFIIITVLLMFSPAAFPQIDSLRSWYDKSVEAYEKGAWDVFLDYTIKFNEVHPSHPVMTYNLAAGYALNEMPAESLNALKRALFIKADQPFETDEDFNMLREHPDYPELLTFRDKQLEKILKADAFSIETPSIVHGESIAYLPGKHQLLIGTVREPAIISFDLNSGNTRVVLPYDSASSHYAFTSVYYDTFSKQLYITGIAMPQVLYFNEDRENHSILIVINEEGRVTDRKVFEENQFQDVIRAGDKLLVSDGLTNTIYELNENGLVKFADLSEEAFNLQSMAYDPANDRLFVADYLLGIYAIDMYTRKASVMPAGDGLVLKGIDGLEFYKGDLFALHNGILPKKVIRYSLENDRIASWEIIDQNSLESGEPTSSVIADDKLYYIANSPWDAYESGEWNPEKADSLEIRIYPIK